MIGTSLRFMVVGGGGGAGSGLQAFNKTILADSPTIQDNRLICAEVISISSAELPAPINKNIVFDSATGTITLQVYMGDTLTINYTKP